ncbi:MAG: prepilin peptidase [Candidatus Baltobacteraceae bacterium]
MGMLVDGSTLSIAAILLGGIACVAAATVDLRERRVPNWLTLLTLAGALTIVSFRGLHNLEASAAIVAGGLILGCILHASGLLGGGDVKLLIGICALVGFPDCIPLLFYTALAGGVLAIAASLVQGRLHEVLEKTVGAVTAMWISKRFVLHRRLEAAPLRERMPYALAIAAGFAILVLSKTYLPALRIPL